MGELYRGKLSSEDAAAALAQLDQIREELRQFPPSDIVWDVEDRSKRPPWGDEISDEITDEITDLSNYFVTEDGRDLFDVLAEAIGYASRAGAPLRVTRRRPLHRPDQPHDTPADGLKCHVREEEALPVMRSPHHTR